MLENEQSRDDRKAKIRQRYVGISTDQLDVIPAKPPEDIFSEDNIQQVAVYARVSTDDPRQTSSYELQKNHYNDIITKTPNWHLVNIYADEGISGTSLNHRDAFLRMIADCRQGKIDLIVTKSVSRFARNVVDCIKLVRELLALPHPVGVFFETERLNTFDPKCEMVLSFMATLAQEESHTKSEIMNSSIEMRFHRGLFLTPVLLGYDHDDDGNLIVNQHEAKIVQLIFKLYLNGCTCAGIAATLTDLRAARTKRGNFTWSAGSILQILQNERYCGDVLARKTFTPNYLDHKSKKNNHDRNQYRQKNHHEAIIPRDEFMSVQSLIRNAKYGNRGLLPELKVIQSGPLKGFVSVNPRWSGFHKHDYVNACKSAYSAVETIPSLPESVEVSSGEFDMRGYEIARSQFFDDAGKATVTFSQKDVRFSKAAIEKLGNQSIEMLVHPLLNALVIRTAEKNCPNALQWSKIDDGIVKPRNIFGAAFLPNMYELFNWNLKCKYRIIGTKQSVGDVSILIFNLLEVECLIPNSLIEESNSDINSINAFKDSAKKNTKGFPSDWMHTFGNDFYRHEQSMEILKLTNRNASPEEVITYKDPEVTLPDARTAEKDIATLLSVIKETKK